MSHTGFQWSDEAAALPPQPQKGKTAFAWSDEGDTPPAASSGQSGTDPGFLDRDIKNLDYGSATQIGLQSIGRGVRSAVQGLGRAIAHPIDTATGIVDSISEAPATIARVPAAIHDINQAPDPLGHYAQATEDTAGQGAGQVIVALGTDGLARGAVSALRPKAAAMPSIVPPPAAGVIEPEYVDAASSPVNARSVAPSEVVGAKQLPQSASVARDLPYRMGPGEVAPEDVAPPDYSRLGTRVQPRIAGDRTLGGRIEPSLPYRFGPGEIAPEDVSTPNPNILAGRRGVRIAPASPPGSGLALPAGSAGQIVRSVEENSDPLLNRLRGIAGNLGQQNASGTPASQPLIGSPLRIGGVDAPPDQDLTDALQESVRMIRPKRGRLVQ